MEKVLRLERARLAAGPVPNFVCTNKTLRCLMRLEPCAAGCHGAPAEPSEEVRLALARLAAQPMLARGAAALAPAARDLAAAVRHALADPCPDIIKVGPDNPVSES